MKQTFYLLILFLASLFIANCHSTTHIKRKQFSNLASPQGNPIAYQKTVNRGLYLFGIYPIYHKAKLENTMKDFSKAARKKRASKIDVIQKDETTWYIVYPPFSFVVTPVTSEIFGALYK